MLGIFYLEYFLSSLDGKGNTYATRGGVGREGRQAGPTRHLYSSAGNAQRDLYIKNGV